MGNEGGNRQNRLHLESRTPPWAGRWTLSSMPSVYGNDIPTGKPGPCMGKTRDLFKKIRDTKGIFHEKMGLIKDRNGMDLTEAEDIKKRWQEYTEELYKKDLHDTDNHDGVIID